MSPYYVYYGIVQWFPMWEAPSPPSPPPGKLFIVHLNIFFILCFKVALGFLCVLRRHRNDCEYGRLLTLTAEPLCWILTQSNPFTEAAVVNTASNFTGKWTTGLSRGSASCQKKKSISLSLRSNKWPVMSSVLHAHIKWTKTRPTDQLCLEPNLLSLQRA